ncbi:MAG TPA: GNAT family protein [Candidatus Acidoferrum sp.]|nr:GNAT family protein [Candidatus Acidoferrum sp.]
MKVYLRAFELDDYKKINLWRRDEEVYRLTGGNKHFVSSERDRKWVEDKIFNNQTEIYLAICLTGTDEMIGYLSLSNIDYRNRRAEWSGIVIGDNQYRGQGYASQAIYLLLEYAFDELGLERVSGSWLADNAVSLFVGKMLGFQQEGVLRRYVYKSGRYHDMIIMSLLREEFEALKSRFLQQTD